MAHSKSFYDDIKKEIECPVCQEQFSESKEPKVLTCQHTFCKSCLEGWLRKQRGGTLSCPTCREITECSNGNINSLPSNLTYKNLGDILKSHSENIGRPSSKEGGNVCKRHKEKVKFYCEQCEICICSECAILEHRDRNDHNIVTLEEGARKEKPILERKMSVVAVKCSRLRSYASSLEKRRAKANRSIAEATKELHRMTECCVNSIREHEASVAELLRTGKSSYDDAFSKQLSKLTEKVQGMDNLSALSKEVLQQNNLQEMLYINQALDERIQQTEEVAPLPNCPEFKYIPNYALSTNLAPGQLYVTTTEPSLSVATGEGLTKSTKDEESTFTITTKDSMGQRTYSEIDKVSVQIKSKQRGVEDIESVIKDLKDGRYFVSYRPNVAGEFSVSIKVRDESIKESPFKLVTKETPSKETLVAMKTIPQTNEANCVMCMNLSKDSVYPLRCGHYFCKSCLNLFTKRKSCPKCKRENLSSQGNQPVGYMTWRTESRNSLPGYEEFGTIVITYNLKDGIQGPEHPNPGQPYCGLFCTSYLPSSPAGQELRNLLRRAFDKMLLFTIEKCPHSGEENKIVSNGIELKTSRSGGPANYGYPDPTYLDRVKRQLAVKGILTQPHDESIQ